MKKLPIMAALLASALSTTSYASEDAGYADISFTVPIVALIDCSNPGTTFTFKAPTNAGAGFTGQSTATNKSSTLAISSNMPNSKLTAQTDVALPAGMQLKIDTESIPGQSDTSGTPLNTPATNPVELTPIGMVSTTTGVLRLNVGLDPSTFAATGGMIPHGTTNLKVIYTLTEN